MNTNTRWLLAPLALAAALVAGPLHAQSGPAFAIGIWDETASAVPNTGNSSPVANWRLDPNASFNGVANAFNGTARLLFDLRGAPGSTYVCSGSLLPGGEWLLTAAHCAEGIRSMTIQFGLYNNTALETRSASGYVLHPGWIASGGALDNGSDVALIRLDAPVTNLNTYYLSPTNDVGKEYIITGYGTSGLGSASSGPNWADSAYGHYGYNVVDVESSVVFGAWGQGTYTEPTYGVTYVTDYDSFGVADPDRYNTLQRMATITGSSAWTSGLALGVGEALIAGGDSGGGDFIWDAATGNWLLSAVHSWGWQFCGGRITPSCDYSSSNSSSFGDLSGSTAVYTHIPWIESVIGRSVTVPIPEPGTYALMLAGLALMGGWARRRRTR